MEPEVSLPCSQQPAIGPYLEPDVSNPHVPTSHLLLGLPHKHIPTKIVNEASGFRGDEFSDCEFLSSDAV